MKRIDQCRVCKSKKLVEFLDLGKQPLANSLLDSPTQKEKFYPLSLSFCVKCSLVQLNHTADPEELFKSYVWVTATSSTAKTHAEVFAKNIITKVKDLKKGYVLEAASNDGTFLIPFLKKGYKVLGVDPAKNIAEQADSEGIPTRAEFFGTKEARKIKKKYGPAKVFIARNVMPHVANLHDFVKGMSVVLEDEGLLALEVHYAKKIYEELHYDSVYHEHLCYFTVKSFETLLNNNGMFIEDIKTSPISGGSLVIYARKGEIKELPIVQKYRDNEEKIKINELKSWQEFSIKVVEHKKLLIDLISKSKGRVVGYGASARSSTLLNYCQIGPKEISVIIDQNPLKQEKYTAGTHILIESADKVMRKKTDTVIILAWNFKDEIIEFLKKQYNYQGKYIIPLPNNPEEIL